MKKRLAAALFVLCWLWVFASAWREPRVYQFDLKTYYIASQVASVGQRRFLSPIDWWVLLGALRLAFQAALLWDVKVGNITVLERLSLRTGFAFLLKKRTTMFVFLRAHSRCSALPNSSLIVAKM